METYFICDDFSFGRGDNKFYVIQHIIKLITVLLNKRLKLLTFYTIPLQPKTDRILSELINNVYFCVQACNYQIMWIKIRSLQILKKQRALQKNVIAAPTILLNFAHTHLARNYLQTSSIRIKY